MEFLSTAGLDPVSRWFYFGADPSWLSLSLSGHSRPAMSCRHIVRNNKRYTAKVTIKY